MSSNPEEVSGIPSAYPEDYVPRAGWTPCRREKARLKYWDFVIYWLEFWEQKRKAGT